MSNKISTQGSLFMREYNQFIVTGFTGDFPPVITLHLHEIGKDVDCVVDWKGAASGRWQGALVEYVPVEPITGFDKLVLTH